MKLCFLLFIFVIAKGALATIYYPLTLSQQLDESIGVIHAKFNSSTYKKLPNNQIVTQLSFKILRVSGVKYSEIINKNDFQIIIPGGKWQGLVYSIPGSPTFEMGKEFILLLSRNKQGFTLSNLGLGKYDIKRNGPNVSIKSSVFPNHNLLGSIDMKEFNELVEERFGEPLHLHSADKVVYVPKNTNTKKVKERTPATSSLKNTDTEESEKSNIKQLMLMFVFVFGVLGYLSRKKILRDD